MEDLLIENGIRAEDTDSAECRLATHPSGHLLASCSSGDALVKFWDCGRMQVTEQNAASTKLSEGLPEDTIGGGGSSADKSVSASSPDLASGHFLPARSFSTYAVRKPQNVSDKPTCRVSPS
ncbi:unnamed protein product [Dibothriocephalus latus]|uniref:Uncharacterized protein n=1 Tax=Dibothriocephalus latus TaxID=60516 RepID=A0A3P7MSM3_DIBLA|nr:unnamed protein product [Dibothriocephalus latus]